MAAEQNAPACPRMPPSLGTSIPSNLGLMDRPILMMVRIWRLMKNINGRKKSNNVPYLCTAVSPCKMVRPLRNSSR